jgi:hypothetical protein
MLVALLKLNKGNVIMQAHTNVETDAYRAEVAQQEKNRTEALALVFICAQDIVDAWPKLTMRTLGQMTARIETLRQALAAAK